MSTRSHLVDSCVTNHRIVREHRARSQPGPSCPLPCWPGGEAAPRTTCPRPAPPRGHHAARLIALESEFPWRGSWVLGLGYNRRSRRPPPLERFAPKSTPRPRAGRGARIERRSPRFRPGPYLHDTTDARSQTDKAESSEGRRRAGRRPGRREGADVAFLNFQRRSACRRTNPQKRLRPGPLSRTVL